MLTPPKRRGRPPKNAPPPSAEEQSEGTELLEEAGEPDPDGYINSILSREQSTSKRRRSVSRESADEDEHDLPDRPPPGWPE